MELIFGFSQISTAAGDFERIDQRGVPAGKRSDKDNQVIRSDNLFKSGVLLEAEHQIDVFFLSNEPFLPRIRLSALALKPFDFSENQ